MNCNVLYLAHETKLNGATKSLLNIIDTLPDEITAVVVVPRNDGPLIEELKKRAINYVYVKYYPCCFKEKRLKDNIVAYVKWFLYRKQVNNKAVKTLIGIVEEKKIHIIHTNSGIVDLGAKVKEQLPQIVHVWHLREFLKEDQGLIPAYGWNNYYSNMKKNTDRIVAVSKSVAEKFAKYVPENKIQVIYNGVASENIAERNRSVENTFNVLQTGAINEYKGIGTSIRALRYLKEMGYSDIELFLAGEGNLNFCKEEYDKVKESVHLLGYVKEMPQLRSGCMDVEVVCSKREAFGRVTVEAMLAGLPVIGANTGGTPELIEDGVTGWIFKCDDYKDLADKILFVYKNRKSAAIVGERAKKIALKKFMISRCVEEIVDMYRDVMKEGIN